ncbi:hypothetical protein EFB08_17420 [Rufibacter latericius]|uniref:Uncharacterized protein n=1 Tax=Rufibacter latericius TaxID=2487040 RepID=A0A3M9MF06_9BACT|nr:hypothetical protein EFB08_17420 [Rufibacter latericius]
MVALPRLACDTAVEGWRGGETRFGRERRPAAPATARWMRMGAKKSNGVCARGLYLKGGSYLSGLYTFGAGGLSPGGIAFGSTGYPSTRTVAMAPLNNGLRRKPFEIGNPLKALKHAKIAPFTTR